MRKSTTAYQFDKDGYLLGTCLVNQGFHDTWAVPSDCTLKVPTFQGGTWSKWNGQEWENEKIPTTARKAIKAKFTCISNDPTKHNQEKKAIIEALVAKDPTHFKTVVDDNFVMSIEMIPELTEEEKKAKLAEEILNKRNQELSATDFYLMSDYPISEEDLRLIQSYRQALRDLPQQEDFPYVEFPEFPL